MPGKIPSQEELKNLLSEEKFAIFNEVCNCVEAKYEMDKIWDNAGKTWDYVCRYRRGGKTLCSLFVKEKALLFMVVLGKTEREKFENERLAYSDTILNLYDTSTTYHDGKWIMMELEDNSLISDIMKLLLIKRRPNRK